MSKRSLILTLGIAILSIGTVSAFVLTARLGLLSEVDSRKIAAVARAHPNFTLEQRQAIASEISAEVHPTMQSLSLEGRAARLAAMARKLFTTDSQPPAAPVQATANFAGNLTTISSPSFGLITLQRQTNCELSLYEGNYAMGSPPGGQVKTSMTNFELALHYAAGLSTRADLFSGGCEDASTGMRARRAVNLGPTMPNQYLVAGSIYNFSTNERELFTASANAGSLTAQPLTANPSSPAVDELAAGDLTGDGVLDLVGFASSGGAITVWLVGANGAIGTPATYAVPGTVTEALVLADVNGDGKLDAVVATVNGSGQESISVLTGRGDGTLNAAQTFAVATPTPPPSGASAQIANLITADLRGSGHQDIVGSNGIVLLNNGSGQFTATSPAFVPLLATSQQGPNLTAADFNRDGKADLAVDDGNTIYIYLGRGDGTFTAGSTYASIGNVGYLAAIDLDGDGNVDLYSGLGNDGGYSGDQFGPGAAYALMGNGDGSFRGATMLPFVYNGNNLVDLTGNGILDGVGVNANSSFTSYLGNGHGGFTAGPSLSFSPVTIGGQQYTVSNLDSYAFGDINGDGKPDLAFIAAGFNGPAGTPGVFVALGNGTGGFETPTFYAVPSTLAGGDIDINWSIYNLHLADVNHDGKADLIYNYSDTSSNTSTIYFGTVVQRGNGDGSFQPPQVIPYRSEAYSEFSNPTETSYVQLITDLNHDGNPDLIFVAQTPTIDFTLSTYVAVIQVALGRGDGTFSTPVTVAGPDLMALSFTDVLPASIAVADMNGDGIPDLIAMGATTSTYDSQVAVMLGNGDGTFRAPILTNYSSQYLNNDQTIAIGDFNGDGKLDVAITDPYDSTGSGISLGNGDGTLQTVTVNGVTLPSQAINLNVSGAATAADFNGDGRTDLLAGGTLLLGQAPVTLAPAIAAYSAGQATLPIVFIGGAAFSNMVVTITKVDGGPTGSAPGSGAIVYNPATGEVTVPEVTVGANTYYNAVATVGQLVSVASVSGADSYEGGDLMISAVQVGGTIYRNVVITPGKILTVAGGMPKAALDQYTPSSKQLLIPAVEFNGHVYTNVTITVGSIVSVGGSG
jgi:hypothetical protein